MNSETATKCEKEELKCPKCGHVQLWKKYSLINVTEKPDLKEKILKNHVFYFDCENCDLVAPLTYDSYYLDSKKKLLIALAPALTPERREEMKVWEEKKGFTKRIVDNINDLKEKIMIADNHLDDRVVEMIKIQYLRQLEREMVNDTLLNLLFDYSGQEMCFIAFFEKKGIGKMPLSMEYYREMEKKYLGQLKAHSTSSFMKVDMEWAGNILFKRH